jgi:hypothetical protein
LTARVDAVTVTDVKAAGRALLTAGPTLAAIGPVSELPAAGVFSSRLGLAA